MAYRIIRDDITKIKADAIVNSANPEPVYMPGTDSAVYLAAGTEKLLEERKKIGVIKEGEVAVTPAFDLDAKYIFHTVGPVWTGGGNGEREIVRKCYLNCLNKAVELGIESIAFPLISTGVYGFPKSEALQIAVTVFSGFLLENDLDVTLAVFDSETFELTGKIFSGVEQYIDENYVEAKLDEEYSLGASVSISEITCSSMPEDQMELASVEDECSDTDERAKDKHHGRLGRNERSNGSFLERKFKKEEQRPIERAFGAAVCAGAAPSAMPVQRSLEDLVRNVSETWTEMLLRLIREKGYEETEVYKRANVDRKHFSKIRSNKDYQPKKNTVVAFALALRLNLDETKDFLARAGYALSPSSKFDVIVEYYIKEDIYEICEINIALFNHDQPLLG